MESALRPAGRHPRLPAASCRRTRHRCPASTWRTWRTSTLRTAARTTRCASARSSRSGPWGARERARVTAPPPPSRLPHTGSGAAGRRRPGADRPSRRPAPLSPRTEGGGRARWETRRREAPPLRMGEGLRFFRWRGEGLSRRRLPRPGAAARSRSAPRGASAPPSGPTPGEGDDQHADEHLVRLERGARHRDQVADARGRRVQLADDHADQRAAEPQARARERGTAPSWAAPPCAATASRSRRTSARTSGYWRRRWSRPPARRSAR